MKKKKYKIITLTTTVKNENFSSSVFSGLLRLISSYSITMYVENKSQQWTTKHCSSSNFSCLLAIRKEQTFAILVNGSGKIFEIFLSPHTAYNF